MIYDYINKLRPGDILFTYKKKSLLSSIIWKFSHLYKFSVPIEIKCSHVAYYMGDELIADISYEGVVIKNIKTYSIKKYILSYGRVEKELDILRMNSYIHFKAGRYKYGYATLLWMGIMKLFNRHKIKDFQKDAVICSEFIIELFKLSGISLIKNKGIGTPLDIMNSSEVKLFFILESNK